MLQSLLNIANPSGIMGLNKRNLTLIYPNNNKEDYHLADDKVQTKDILHKNNIACATTYAVIKRSGKIKAKWENCKHYNAMAIKPANGMGGGGIKIIKKDARGNWISGGKSISKSQIFQHINAIVSGMFSMNSTDSCLIEECIIPHPFFAEIYGDGVPDFRIITLKGMPLIAMLRMPTSKSDGKANLHQKGVGIGVCMETGTLTEVYDGKQYLDHHPDNPTTIVGKKIPFWDEMLALSVATATAFPLQYMGIDIVLDVHKGPQVMEVNVRPGLGIQLVNKCGMEKVVQKKFPNYFTGKNSPVLFS